MTAEQLHRWLRLIASNEVLEVVNAVAVAIARAEKTTGVAELEATIVLLAHLTGCASRVLNLDLREVLSEVCVAAATLEVAAQAEKLPC